MEISNSQYELTQFSHCHELYAQKRHQYSQPEYCFRHSHQDTLNYHREENMKLLHETAR